MLLLRSMRLFMMQSWSTACAQFITGSFKYDGGDAYEDEAVEAKELDGDSDDARSFGGELFSPKLGECADEALLDVSKQLSRRKTGWETDERGTRRSPAKLLCEELLMLVNCSRSSSAIGRIARGAYRDERLGCCCCVEVLLVFFSFLTTRRFVGPKLHAMSVCACLASAALAPKLLAVERAYPDEDEAVKWLLPDEKGEEEEDDDNGDSDVGIFFFRPAASLVVAMAIEVRDSDAVDTFFLAVDGSPRAEIMLDEAEKNFGDDEDDELPPLLLLGEEDNDELPLFPPDGEVDHIPPKEEENAACWSPLSLDGTTPRLLELGRFCHLKLSDGEDSDDDDEDVAPAAAMLLLLEKVCSLMTPWCPPPWLTPSDEDEMLPLFPLLQRHQGWPSPPPPLLLTALGPSLLLMLFLKSMLGKPGYGACR